MVRQKLFGFTFSGLVLGGKALQLGYDDEGNPTDACKSLANLEDAIVWKSEIDRPVIRFD